MLERIKLYYRHLKIKALKLILVQPNYAFKNLFHKGDRAIDIGTGDDPDFSKHMILNYGLESYAFDPTQKHAPFLKVLEEELDGFHYYQFAVGNQDGKKLFYESLDNVSGSLLTGHRNIVNDRVISYIVDVISIESLFKLIPRQSVAIMKVDIEGAEYELIQSIDLKLLHNVRQLIVEFHHETVQNISWEDTKKAVKRIKKAGMKAFSYNGRDFLFYW